MAGLLNQIGMANPGLVFSQVDRENLLKRQLQQQEAWRNQQAAMQREQMQALAPYRQLQAQMLERQVNDYRTPEQKQAAEIEAYRRKQEIENLFRRPEKSSYQYFDRADGVYAYDPATGKSWKMQGVPGKPGEQKGPEDQYAKSIADFRELERQIASIGAGQNISDAALGSGRGEQVARLTSQRDNLKNYLVSKGVNPGALGYGAEAYGQGRPEVSMAGEEMRQQRQGQPQVQAASPMTTGEFDGKNVVINGKQYPVEMDGTVTVNGVKYRVRQ